jgi:hypothetical protein
MSGRAGGGSGADAATCYNALTTPAAGRAVDSGAAPAVDRAPRHRQGGQEGGDARRG